jgi:hypothetical protein
MSKTDTTQSYWDNEGKYQEQYNAAWKALIPIEGEAEDGWPEALRSISRIGYDYHNNGFCNLWRYWEDVDEDGHDTIERTMDSYYEDMVDYLRYHVPSDLYREFRDWLPTINYGSISWGENGDGVIDRIIDHIMEGIIKDGLLEEELVS